VVDIARPDQVRALHARTAGATFGLVFVVAGVAGQPEQPIHAVSPQEAADVFLTNAYWPVVFAETFLDRLAKGGTVALMTSILGSVSNSNGGFETYRASKAALNMLGRCFAARHPDCAVLLLHPGWVRTDMGGPDAPLDVATSVRGLADVLEARAGRPGDAFLDYTGNEIGW
jgi:NAD(P)-dependent dehydrogenase (short-subunit alcohol dehydrogenase family)